MKKTLTLAGVLCLTAASYSAYAFPVAKAVQDRAEFFNRTLDAPSDDVLNTPVGKKITNVRNLKTVLPGVLYRSGGPGGQVQINNAGLKSLCEAGFEKAYYLYPNGFTGRRSVTCTGPDGKENSIEYVQQGFITASDKYKILKEIHARIENPDAGPALVHCWNGYHASGEISAVALRQFCEYSGEKGTSYWMKNQKGAPQTQRIRKFEDFSDLRITSDLQSALCPR